MIKTLTVKQIVSYEPVADQLAHWLEVIQGEWGCEVLNVFETKVNNSPNQSKQGFIILYKDAMWKHKEEIECERLQNEPNIPRRN